MSFLKKLFKRSDSKITAPLELKGADTEYNGFVIRATPYVNEGQYQCCGVIVKTLAGEECEHRFIRADRYPDTDIAVAMIHVKGRQIIDERGDKLFE